jgi:hypothetical protein
MSPRKKFFVSQREIQAAKDIALFNQLRSPDFLKNLKEDSSAHLVSLLLNKIREKSSNDWRITRMASKLIRRHPLARENVQVKKCAVRFITSRLLSIHDLDPPTFRGGQPESAHWIRSRMLQVITADAAKTLG